MDCHLHFVSTNFRSRNWLCIKTYIRDKKFDDRKSEAQKIVDDAKIEAERLKKESIQEAKETVSDMKRDAEIDIKERKDVVVELETN